MQIDLTPVATLIIAVALILAFGSDRLLYFWDDLKKAGNDVRGMFRRGERDERDADL